MTQLDLFPAPAPAQDAPRMDTHAAGRVGSWEWRTLPGGLVQTREYIAGRPDRWRFVVAGFKGPDDGIASLCWRERDGSLAAWGRDVPMTRKGYLTIDGRRYGPGHWTH